ncbi:MAG: DUF2569 family protein [Prevotellaceae bacterium]|nr:DUF2569 family protein [Prevotellaceae bacterium]
MNEETALTNEATTQELPSEKKHQGTIQGWLAFFLVVRVGAGTLLTIVMSAMNFSIQSYVFPHFNAVMQGLGYLVAVVDIVSVPVLGIYTIYAFYTYKPNAVALGKSYVIMMLIINAITLLIGEQETAQRMINIAFSLVWGVVWLAYLLFSEQVNELFPAQQRKLYLPDKILLAIVFGVPLLWIPLVYLYTLLYI